MINMTKQKQICVSLLFVLLFLTDATADQIFPSQVNKNECKEKRIDSESIIRKCYDADGILENEKTIRNGKMTVWKTYYKNSQIQSVMHFENDKRVGESRTYYENGNIKGIYDHDIGKSQVFYENGKPQYFENEETGETKDFFKSGGVLIRNSKQGTMKQFNEYGIIEKESFKQDDVTIIEKTYQYGLLIREKIEKNGEYVQEKTFKKNGISKSYHAGFLHEITYKDDEFDGLAREYYKNGTIHKEYFRKGNNIYYGPLRTYYENGELSSEINLEDSKKHGFSKYYSDNGKLEKEEVYENGKLVSIKEYDGEGNLLPELKKIGRRAPSLKVK